MSVLSMTGLIETVSLHVSRTTSRFVPTPWYDQLFNLCEFVESPL
jgi:hypothetical protein